ncbi:MAG: YolD-like family protein [Lachnospiraceae bacterium]|jgi:hypothetical protein|nr:YolD-like family protein [Lachnospiraceae bacterium]
MKYEDDNRAKIFAPFDSLTGFFGEINEAGIIHEEKVTLTDNRQDELEANLNELYNRGHRELVTVIYYSDTLKNYVNITGHVDKIDPLDKTLLLSGNLISFSNIFDIEIINL